MEATTTADGDSHGAENHAGTKMTDRCNRKISLFGPNERRRRGSGRTRTPPLKALKQAAGGVVAHRMQRVAHCPTALV